MSKPSSSSAWLRPILAPLAPFLRELVFSSFFINILALTVPVFIQQVYDRVVFHAGIATLQGLAIGVAVLLIFDFVLRIARGRLMQRVALHIDVEVGEKLFDKLMALPLRTLEARPSSHWQALFRDADLIRNTLSGPTAVLVADLPFVAVFLVMMFVIAAPLAWTFLAILPAFIGLAWYSGARLGKAGERERSATVRRDSLMGEIIGGRGTVKALALDHAVRPLWEERQAAVVRESIGRGAGADGFVSAGMVLTMMTTVIMTAVGALMIIEQTLTVGALIAVNMLASRLLAPVNQLVGAWRSFAGFRQAVARVGEAFNLAEDRRERGIAMERPKGALACEAVTFRYAENAAPAVEAVSQALPSPGVTAIVGRNGCGKTTFLKLLLGLYAPEEGRVLLDGADLAQFTRAELAGWIGYVPQECVLLDGTIRDNIAHGRAGVSEDEILAAAQRAGVHQYIVDLPDGYATRVGEAGSRLSAGQRQRIALARALVGDPPVLVMDEPSASLDRQAEEELRTLLTRLAVDRTVVVVTHSPLLLPVARHIMVMDRGKVTAAGPAAEILPALFGRRPPQPPQPPRPPQSPATPMQLHATFQPTGVKG